MSTLGHSRVENMEEQLRRIFYSLVDNVVGEMQTRFSERHWQVILFILFSSFTRIAESRAALFLTFRKDISIVLYSRFAMQSLLWHRQKAYARTSLNEWSHWPFWYVLMWTRLNLKQNCLWHEIWCSLDQDALIRRKWKGASACTTSPKLCIQWRMRYQMFIHCMQQLSHLEPAARLAKHPSAHWRECWHRIVDRWNINEKQT